MPDPSLLNLGPVPFRGPLLKDSDLSGLAVVGEFLIVGSDETAVAQILNADGDGYMLFSTVVLEPSGLEVDIEGVAAADGFVYVTGSHSRVRKLIKPHGTPGEIDEQPTRDQFFRFPLAADGTVGKVERASLRHAIDADPILAPFARIASKENGIDIEGLAAKGNKLYFGFRGPVLRNNWVPVLRCKFDEPTKSAKLLFVQLAGRGIRDFVALDDGFLILAGPVGDSDLSYRLYHWDGHDCADPGTPGKIAFLADFPTTGAEKPEGVTILKSTPDGVEILTVCDGLPGGGPTRWRVQLPGKR